MTSDNTTNSAATAWRELCPELVKLEKSLGLADPASELVEASGNSAACLNRWSHPDAHTLMWMESQALNRIRIDEELARMPTEDSSKNHSTARAVQKQVNDDDYVLDQGFSTGCTDRVLRAEDRDRIVKSHDEANVELRSEYTRRDSLDDLEGPLDMGCSTDSSLGH